MLNRLLISNHKFTCVRNTFLGSAQNILTNGRLYSTVNQNSDGDLVYRNSKKTFVVALKAFSVSSTTIALGFQPYAYFNFPKGDIAFIAIYMGLNISMISLFLLHMFTKSFVTDLYYNHATDTFTAYTKGILCNTKKTAFKAEDVTFDITSLAFANISVKKDGKLKPLFINEEDFKDVNVYRKLIQFDQPLKYDE